MQRLIVVLATVLAWSMAASPAQPSAATLASPSPALYGVTINEVGHLEEIVGSLAAFAQRVQSYVSVLAPNVDIWEIGNEVNGNWTGPYATVSAKLTAAYEEVTAADGKTALTFYANNFAKNNCGDGPAELTPVQFAQQYVPAQVANGLDYVFLSYYPRSAGTPSRAPWTSPPT